VGDAISLVPLDHGSMEEFGIFPPLSAIGCEIFVSKVLLPALFFLQSGCLGVFPVFFGLSLGPKFGSVVGVFAFVVLNAPVLGKYR